MLVCGCGLAILRSCTLEVASMFAPSTLVSRSILVLSGVPGDGLPSGDGLFRDTFSGEEALEESSSQSFLRFASKFALAVFIVASAFCAALTLAAASASAFTAASAAFAASAFAASAFTASAFAAFAAVLPLSDSALARARRSASALALASALACASASASASAVALALASAPRALAAATELGPATASSLSTLAFASA